MITINDVIQYMLIAALFAAALADRYAHRDYARVLTALYTDLRAAVTRIEDHVKDKLK